MCSGAYEVEAVGRGRGAGEDGVDVRLAGDLSAHPETRGRHVSSTQRNMSLVHRETE